LFGNFGKLPPKTALKGATRGANFVHTTRS